MVGDEWLISRAAPDGGRLRLRFARQGDRLHQTVEWLAAATNAASTIATSPVVALLESCEGQSSDTWPDSPPLQQLLIEPRGAAGHVALLVGMAGRSHWSLSIEPLVDRVGFRFDAACRLSGPPEWLGHVWRAAAAARERPVATGRLRIVAEDGAECQMPPALAPEALAPDALATESLATESLATESLATEAIATEAIATEAIATEAIATEAIATKTIPAESNATGSSATGSSATEATLLEAVAECRVRAVDASSVAARGRFPATVQWRFVLEWAQLSQ
jgi:hypothetical protein